MYIMTSEYWDYFCLPLDFFKLFQISCLSPTLTFFLTWHCKVEISFTPLAQDFCMITLDSALSLSGLRLAKSEIGRFRSSILSQNIIARSNTHTYKNQTPFDPDVPDLFQTSAEDHVSCQAEGISGLLAVLYRFVSCFQLP